MFEILSFSIKFFLWKKEKKYEADFNGNKFSFDFLRMLRHEKRGEFTSIFVLIFLLDLFFYVNAIDFKWLRSYKKL